MQRDETALAMHFAKAMPIGTRCRYYPVLPADEDAFEETAAKLRSLLEGEPGRKHTEEILLEAEDELRAAAEHCADSVRSLRREATR